MFFYLSFIYVKFLFIFFRWIYDCFIKNCLLLFLINLKICYFFYNSNVLYSSYFFVKTLLLTSTHFFLYILPDFFLNFFLRKKVLYVCDVCLSLYQCFCRSLCSYQTAEPIFDLIFLLFESEVTEVGKSILSHTSKNLCSRVKIIIFCWLID